jgi:hypothetical protein
LWDNIPHIICLSSFFKNSYPDPVNDRSSIILNSVLHLLRPAVRLMLRHGVAYPAFAAALKQVFLGAAQDELQARGMAQTDSAVSLLSGVHRRDVRNLTRADEPAPAPQAFAGLASQVVARWLSQDLYLDENQTPIAIARLGPIPSFDALVQAVTQDVRPRSLLDELIRLGLAAEDDGQVTLLAQGFVPRAGLPELAALIQNNLFDHVAAACENFDHKAAVAGQIRSTDATDFLEQSVFVDEITSDSADRLHEVSRAAWKLAFQTVMRDAQRSFDHDAVHASADERSHRARFGVYFYSTPVQGKIDTDSKEPHEQND